MIVLKYNTRWIRGKVVHITNISIASSNIHLVVKSIFIPSHNNRSDFISHEEHKEATSDKRDEMAVVDYGYKPLLTKYKTYDTQASKPLTPIRVYVPNHLIL
ncbi:hypothetical protein Hanom_Chr10g00941051 [Helianthus anomalus]